MFSIFLDAQKNCLIETAPFSTHNICKKIIFLLSTWKNLINCNSDSSKGLFKSKLICDALDSEKGCH